MEKFFGGDGSGHFIISLALIWALEQALPADRGRQGIFRHAAINLSLTLLNLLIITAAASLVILRVAEWSAGYGLLYQLPFSGPSRVALAFLFFDGWMYIWHRLNHRVPFLWRFHSVHHSDPAMDVTTASRFHPGEIMFSTIGRLIMIPLLGMTIAELLIYEALLIPVIQFHHSNIRIPAWLDRGLRTLIASPGMHRIHHSPLRQETDSNYSSILSIWDRLGGTFRLRDEGSRDRGFGLEGTEKRQALVDLLSEPLRNAMPNASVSERQGASAR